MSYFKLYEEEHAQVYVDVEIGVYSPFDVVEDSPYEVYTELVLWDNGGYVSNYQLAVL